MTLNDESIAEKAADNILSFTGCVKIVEETHSLERAGNQREDMLRRQLKRPLAGNAPISKDRQKNMDLTGVSFCGEQHQAHSLDDSDEVG